MEDVFWERVKKLLKAHKMTQKQFADYMGVPVNTLYGWIKYNRIPDTVTANGIAIVLGVTLNYLLDGGDIEITEYRLIELNARHAAARILNLTAQIEEETKKIRPLMKITPP